MAKVSLNDIQARVQLIAGQVRLLDRILMDDDCPQDRWGMIDFCTTSVLKQLERLNHNLAATYKESQDAT